MSKKQFAFDKGNFIILGFSILIIIIGFLLMTGAKSTEEAFDPNIFNTQRIVIAPIVTMIGFLMVVWAILKKPKDKKEIN